MKILFLDDDADLSELTIRRLKKKGLDVVSAVTFAEGQAVYEREKSSIEGVICDLFLDSGKNGMDFHVWIRGLGFAGRYALATGDDTGDSRIDDVRKKDPQFRCFQKPYSMDELVAFFQ